MPVGDSVPATTASSAPGTASTARVAPAAARAPSQSRSVPIRDGAPGPRTPTAGVRRTSSRSGTRTRGGVGGELRVGRGPPRAGVGVRGAGRGAGRGRGTSRLAGLVASVAARVPTTSRSRAAASSSTGRRGAGRSTAPHAPQNAQPPVRAAPQREHRPAVTAAHLRHAASPRDGHLIPRSHRGGVEVHDRGGAPGGTAIRATTASGLATTVKSTHGEFGDSGVPPTLSRGAVPRSPRGEMPRMRPDDTRSRAVTRPPSASRAREPPGAARACRCCHRRRTLLRLTTSWGDGLGARGSTANSNHCEATARRSSRTVHPNGRLVSRGPSNKQSRGSPVG